MNLFKKLLDGVRDVAPTLAEVALAGATGGPVGVVASIMRKITGAGEDRNLEDMAGDILGDPEKMMAFRLESRKAELEELKIRTLDVQDARKTLTISKGAVIISTIVVLGYFVATLIVMTMAIPVGSQNLAYLLLGNLGTGFGMVLTFWLGSSVGSKEKDATMARYADAARADQAARPRQDQHKIKGIP